MTLKKITLITLFFLLLIIISLKALDYIFFKIYGLGNPVIYKSSKIYGYSLKPDQNLKRRGKSIIINNKGMRSSKNWNSKIEESFNILFFGDSVTYGGSIVNNNEIFSEIICKQLSLSKYVSYRCGNLGVNGYSLFSIVRRIQYKSINNEDLLIITIIGNNFSRTFHNPLSQPFWTKPIDNHFPSLTELMFIYLEKYRNEIKYKLGSELDNSNLDYEYYKNLINELFDVLDKNKKKYLLFYSPSLNEINGSKNYNNIKNIIKKRFPDFIDLSKIEYRSKEKLYYDNIHLNKKGHEIYADFMSKKINELLAD
tara:strand:+ start:90 stop:1022 length:933 start_codon:yes stop_codon:yes gene_type:complete